MAANKKREQNARSTESRQYSFNAQGTPDTQPIQITPNPLHKGASNNLVTLLEEVLLDSSGTLTVALGATEQSDAASFSSTDSTRLLATESTDTAAFSFASDTTQVTLGATEQSDTASFLGRDTGSLVSVEGADTASFAFDGQGFASLGATEGQDSAAVAFSADAVVSGVGGSVTGMVRLRKASVSQVRAMLRWIEEQELLDEETEELTKQAINVLAKNDEPLEEDIVGDAIDALIEATRNRIRAIERTKLEELTKQIVALRTEQMRKKYLSYDAELEEYAIAVALEDW